MNNFPPLLRARSLPGVNTSNMCWHIHASTSSITHALCTRCPTQVSPIPHHGTYIQCTANEHTHTHTHAYKMIPYTQHNKNVCLCTYHWAKSNSLSTNMIIIIRWQEKQQPYYYFYKCSEFAQERRIALYKSDQPPPHVLWFMWMLSTMFTYLTTCHFSMWWHVSNLVFYAHCGYIRVKCAGKEYKRYSQSSWTSGHWVIFLSGHPQVSNLFNYLSFTKAISPSHLCWRKKVFKKTGGELTFRRTSCLFYTGQFCVFKIRSWQTNKQNLLILILCK